MKFSKSTPSSPFQLTGQVLALTEFDRGQPKYLRLASAEGEVTIKLAKTLRKQREMLCRPGDWVRVIGEKKFKLKNSQIRFKAEQVIRLRADGAAIAVPKQPKACDRILICQKSDCCARGAKAVAQALESQLVEKGLSDRVQIQKTGCLKQCKAAPTLMIASDKTRYHRLSPGDVPALIDKHFSHLQPREAFWNPKSESAIAQKPA